MGTIKCGVPQGSIMGPLLFILFVNDLTQATTLDPIIFADDTNLSYSNKNIDTLFQIIYEELVKFNMWFRANKLSLNANKTKFISFHKLRSKKIIPSTLPILKINDTEIKRNNR